MFLCKYSKKSLSLKKVIKFYCCDHNVQTYPYCAITVLLHCSILWQTFCYTRAIYAVCDNPSYLNSCSSHKLWTRRCASKNVVSSNTLVAVPPFILLEPVIASGCTIIHNQNALIIGKYWIYQHRITKIPPPKKQQNSTKNWPLHTTNKGIIKLDILTPIVGFKMKALPSFANACNLKATEKKLTSKFS